MAAIREEGRTLPALSRRQLLISSAATVAVSNAPLALAQAKGAISIGLSSAAATLDPAKSNSGPDLAITRQIFDTLIARNPKTGEHEPRLATQWKLLNDQTWQLSLRKGVQFHNGEPFDATAVKFSIERYLNPELRSPHASVLGFIDRVDVVDELTVNVLTKTPYPVFLTHLSPGSTGTILMVPPKYIAEKGDAYFADNPVGTGPYKFAEWVRGNNVRFVANEAYWRGAPAIGQVTFRFVPEPSTRISALLAGDLTLIQNVPPDLVPLVRKNPKTGTAVSESGGLVMMMQLTPAAHPALADKRVRKAMNHAVDIDTIIETLLGGMASRRTVPVDPGAVGANPNLKPYAFDVDRAKKLMAEAGYANGFALDVYTSDGRYVSDRPIADAYAEYLAAIGIKINVRSMEWAQLVTAMAKRQGGPMYQIGWSFAEGDVFKLKAALHPEARYSTFDNKEFGDLIDKAETSMDPEARRKFWWQAQEILVEEAPFVHAWQPHVIFGKSNQLDWTATGEAFFVYDMKLK